MKFMHETVAGIEKSAVERGYSNSKAFAAGNCKVFFCNEHDNCLVLTGGKCRYAQHARPSMSSHGVNVKRIMEAINTAESFLHNERQAYLTRPAFVLCINQNLIEGLRSKPTFKPPSPQGEWGIPTSPP